MMALLFQKQEAFLSAHVRAFDFFGGVPKRVSYDSLTAAAARTPRGDKRREIAFLALRHHYLSASHFCSCGTLHEKGQTENLVGRLRRTGILHPPSAVRGVHGGAGGEAPCCPTIPRASTSDPWA